MPRTATRSDRPRSPCCVELAEHNGADEPFSTTVSPRTACRRSPSRPPGPVRSASAGDEDVAERLARAQPGHRSTSEPRKTRPSLSRRSGSPADGGSHLGKCSKRGRVAGYPGNQRVDETAAPLRAVVAEPIGPEAIEFCAGIEHVVWVAPQSSLLEAMAAFEFAGRSRLPARFAAHTTSSALLQGGIGVARNSGELVGADVAGGRRGRSLRARRCPALTPVRCRHRRRAHHDHASCKHAERSQSHPSSFLGGHHRVLPEVGSDKRVTALRASNRAALAPMPPHVIDSLAPRPTEDREAPQTVVGGHKTSSRADRLADFLDGVDSDECSSRRSLSIRSVCVLRRES